jgi:hypothetical protein
LGPIPNPQSPIPNPQSPIPNPHFGYKFNIFIKVIIIKKKLKINMKLIIKIIKYVQKKEAKIKFKKKGI